MLKPNTPSIGEMGRCLCLVFLAGKMLVSELETQLVPATERVGLPPTRRGLALCAVRAVLVANLELPALLLLSKV